MTKETTPSVAEQADLLQIARDIEGMKRDCGMDPESPTAIYNSKLMNIGYRLRAFHASQAASHSAPEPVAPEAVRWADDLARYIADMTGVEIGKHSTPNNPWFNACEAARDFIQQREAAPLGAESKACASVGVGEAEAFLRKLASLPAAVIRSSRDLNPEMIAAVRAYGDWITLRDGLAFAIMREGAAPAAAVPESPADKTSTGSDKS